MKLLLAFLAFDIIVIVHELGHFIAARLVGIKVLEFSLFIGPKIFSVQRGETMYSIRLIPALAYVKMEGEEEESPSERAYYKKPLYARIAAVGAGPLASLLLGVVFLAITYSVVGYDTTALSKVFGGSPAYTAGIRTGDKIISYDGKRVYQPLDVGLFLYASKGKTTEVVFSRGGQQLKTVVKPDVIPANRYMLGFEGVEAYGEKSNVVRAVQPDFPAAKAGIIAGDTIIMLNDRNVSSREQISSYMNENKDKPLDVTVLRKGQKIVLRNITPVVAKGPEQYDVGVIFTTEKGGPLQIVWNSMVNTYSITRIGFYSILWLIKGEVPLNQMTGPVGIVSTINTVVQQSPSPLFILLDLLRISALISIGLGVTNLLPIPPSDGSKLLFLAVEGVRRKPIPLEKEAFISMIGFAIMLMLFIVLTYNDILRIFTGG